MGALLYEDLKFTQESDMLFLREAKPIGMPTGV